MLADMLSVTRLPECHRTVMWTLDQLIWSMQIYAAREQLARVGEGYADGRQVVRQRRVNSF